MKALHLFVSIALGLLLITYRAQSQNPTHISSISNGTGGAMLVHPNAIKVSGNYAYLACNGSDALEIVNISDPANPIHTTALLHNTTTGTMLEAPTSVYVSGNYAYVVSQISDALEIVDISNPASPQHKGSLVNGTGGALLSNPLSVFVSGNYAYIASIFDDAIEIVDISDPTAPVHKSSIINGTGGALLDSPNSVYVSGNFAYVASFGSNALEIINISNPAAPVHAGSLANSVSGALLSQPHGVHVSGNYAYVASGGSNALEIIDISNPAAPFHKGSLTNGSGGALLNNPYGIYVSGNYAYIVNTVGDALEVADITDPAHPVHAGSLSNGEDGALLDNPSSVYVSNDYVYISSNGSNTMEIAYFNPLATQTITGFNAIPLQTYGNSALTLSGITATSGLPVSFTSSDLGVATISGNRVMILSAGVTTIIAMQPGNNTYAVANPVKQVLTVNKAEQTITLATLPDVTLSGQLLTITLTGTASSGLPVSYSLFTDPSDIAMLSGSLLSLSKAGTITVTGLQTGNGNYNTAMPVQAVFTVHTLTGTQNVPTITGINSQEEILPVIIYPNPNNGDFRIIQISSLPVQATLFNSQGQVVRWIMLKQEITEVNGILPGFYLLKVGSEVKRVLVE